MLLDCRKSINNGLEIGRCPRFFANRTLYVLLCLCLLIAFTAGCKQPSNSEKYNQAALYYKDKEYNKSFKLFMELAEEENPAAQAHIGNFYYHGVYVERDFDKAKYWFERSANLGNKVAMSLLGAMYRYGQGVTRDCKKSLSYYNQSISKYDSSSLYSLFEMYRNGICVDLDIEKSNEYLVLASKSNDPYGLLARMLRRVYGVDVDVDLESAVIMGESILSEYDFQIAAYYLYLFYIEGLGVERNVDKALKYLHRASVFGVPEADYNLAYMHLVGKYLEQDYSKAYSYALKSQEKVKESAGLLGMIYEKGLGVAVDKNEARRWYEQAVSMGCEVSKERLNKLVEQCFSDEARQN